MHDQPPKCRTGATRQLQSAGGARLENQKGIETPKYRGTPRSCPALGVSPGGSGAGAGSRVECTELHGAIFRRRLCMLMHFMRDTLGRWACRRLCLSPPHAASRRTTPVGSGGEQARVPMTCRHWRGAVERRTRLSWRARAAAPNFPHTPKPKSGGRVGHASTIERHRVRFPTQTRLRAACINGV